jgi:primosomal protein N' (replication factor Y)
VDEIYAYTIPDGAEAAPGCRVFVPYRGRRVAAIVLETVESLPQPPRHPLRELEVLDQAPAIPAPLLDVILRLARDTLTPPGTALSAAIPPGSSPRPGHALRLLPAGRRALERGEARGDLARMLWALGRRARPESEIRRRFRAISGVLERLERLGWIARESDTEPARVRARQVRFFRLDDGADSTELERQLARAPRQRAIVERLREGPAELPSSSALRALVSSGIVHVELREVTRALELPPLAETEKVTELTPHQTAALHRIVEAMASGHDAAFLLYGITGSGKTEVYLRATDEALRRGSGAIVLVPEISLTHQVVDRFRAHFGEQVAVLHSGLSDGERYDQWRQIREGHRSIVIGARSAVFAPLERPGLIVIDEEHDPAYKSEEGFRYHAREAAFLRAREAGCPVVMGSATPDVETTYRAEHGEIERLVLPDRIASRPLPAVHFVDMSRELLRRGRRLVLSRAMRHALAETLARGQQAILFLNRRGFATLVYCNACGYAARCKHCDISLVYHATGTSPRRVDPEEGELRCHYCGFHQDPPTTCPRCGSPEGALFGFGTERVAEEVGALFAHARVERLDRDAASRKGEQRRILGAFHRGEVDVLVGTQMVTKGHDIPGVTLVGVVAADLGLHFPDFRAGERTFQLLTQVAGRAGRGEEPGRVIVQTFLPDHYAIALARTHDYPSFYREELARRRPHSYPPFAALGQVLVTGLEEARVEEVAALLAQVARTAPLPDAAEEGLDVLGPAPAPIPRIRDRFRWHVLLRGEPGAVREAGREVLRQARERARGVRVRVDPAPLQML